MASMVTSSQAGTFLETRCKAGVQIFIIRKMDG